jgi:hypothetical protein
MSLMVRQLLNVSKYFDGLALLDKAMLDEALWAWARVSTLNDVFQRLGELHEVSQDLINSAKLQFCGQFVFACRKVRQKPEGR